MPRLLFAVAVASVAVAPERASAFGGHFVYCPMFGPRFFAPPPVFVVPVYAAPAPTFGPCCDAPSATNIQQPGSPVQPPRVQEMPSGAAVEPAPPAREIHPAGEAVPRAAEPLPAREADTPTIPPTAVPIVPKRPTADETPQAPRPADKTSDGLPIPKLNVPATPAPAPATPKSPATPGDPAFPPLPKLLPPNESGTSESLASPLAGNRLPRTEVYPVDGPTPAPGGSFTAGFHNRTDQEVTLTVQGETVTLPGRHSVTARVPAGFAWRIDGGPEQTTEVPGGSPGVEVVIRR